MHMSPFFSPSTLLFFSSEPGYINYDHVKSNFILSVTKAVFVLIILFYSIFFSPNVSSMYLRTYRCTIRKLNDE